MFYKVLRGRMTSFHPAVWGPRGWFFVNTVVLALPKRLDYETGDAVRSFLGSLRKLLPCGVCRDHYVAYWDDVPLDTSRRDTVWEWVTGLHNRVAGRTGKAAWSAIRSRRTHLAHFRSSGSRWWVGGRGTGVLVLMLVLLTAYLLRHGAARGVVWSWSWV